MERPWKKIKAPGKMTVLQWALRVVQGMLIGGGAILPGISGGVLCVSFGIYQPMMATLAHPKEGLRKYGRLLLPVGLGWLLGFWCFAALIDLLFGADSVLATWLFIGLIAGTMPTLLKEAGSQKGRTKGAWLALTISFIVMTGVFLLARLNFSAHLTPNVWWFLFCGILWGLSLVVPGMTSSSILMSMALYEPMVEGISALDPLVIVPMLVGIVAVVLSCAKLVNYLFKHYYALAYHAIIGIVAASTLVLIPLKYESVLQLILSLLLCAVGFIIAWRMERMSDKLEKKTA